MKQLNFLYSMQIQFDEPVTNHRFTLKCIPGTDERQQINNLHIDIHPKEFLSTNQDSFGNTYIYGYEPAEHDNFSIIVTGEAKTGLTACLPAGEVYKLGCFKYQTEYTRPGECLKAFYASVNQQNNLTALTNIEKAQIYMDYIYEEMTYQQGVTDINTTAEQAFSLKKGVCQDYSHILLSLCRMDQIPCRYVVGMLMGEGLSHGWVEIYDNRRWFALDPTNHLIVDDQHIKISNGRDFTDCTINQGLFTGKTTQTQHIRVNVSENTSL